MKYKILDVLKNKETGENRIITFIVADFVNGKIIITYGFENGLVLKGKQIEEWERIEDGEQINKITMELLNRDIIK